MGDEALAMVDEPADVENVDSDPRGDIVPHEPVTIQLIYPVMFGTRKIESLTIRPTTAKDFRRCKTSANHEVPWQLELAGFCSGEPPQVIDLLQAPDAVEVLGAMANFLVVSRRTGTKL